ncbi:thymidylate synthase [Actinoplanes lobatus]|uniref:Thymidylate synthase n=1 Tax=Actinoplanes lobatus TaxID=113568 RepID=A0A7W7MLR7_9ACTN|nr:thymidylate synthase [Actinoplanes lobatus]MBB4755074.1 thymidylate synthase [Actinoplanes lobatus]GGN82183.1 thymidylate synthase [Actinoplanes lobatus]GIE40609.1 thymidylate synthase [Actinoplanes lobatus]
MTLTPATFDTFGDAYVAVLRRIHDQPEYDTRGRGKGAVEVPNVSFRLTDPVRRSPYLVARRANIVFNHAEALWYLSGCDDLAMIGYYAPRLEKLSADGIRLTGTAYGPRLFAVDDSDGRSQFDRVIDLLRHDPDSKRAAMLVMRPDELIDPDNPDVACTLALQFLLRGGRLHATASMRGNDAFIGLLCDTFSFTMIQELAARRLSVEVGTYTHHVGSMHINVLDVAKVEAILAETDRAPAPMFPCSEMPDTSPEELDTVLWWEQALRLGGTTLTVDAVARIPVSGYWRQVLLLFEAYRQIRQTGDPVTVNITAALTAGNRWLMAARWPDRIGMP